MNFGVSGSIGACSSHIYSNPITQAAVKRQQEKERLARAQLTTTDGPLKATAVDAIKTRLMSNRATIAKSKEEEEWHSQFQNGIMVLRLRHTMIPKLEILQQKINEYRIDQNREALKRTTAELVIREGVIGTPFTVEDIKGPRRHRPLSSLRMVLMAKVYVECPHLSLPQIGKAFGGRDHTTVLHSVVKMGVHQPAKEYGLRSVYRQMAAA